MRKAAIFDIDGTLADCTHRLHHVKHGARNWDAFFAGMAGDTLIQPVADLVDALSAQDEVAIVLCSGRPEDYREITELWLIKHRVYFDKLYMRPAGDTRPDHVVKSQILDGIREDGFEPFIVIDDRRSVVDMWRDRGLTCLQAAPDRPKAPDTAILSLMVGPSGAGKSDWLQGLSARYEYGISAHHVVSSDCVRHDLCGDFRDQSKNDAVFDAVHAVARTRLVHGLPTVIDATHLRRKDRMTSAALAPDGCKVRYFVIDRPIAEKRSDGGWRNYVLGDQGAAFDLIGKHDQTFRSQIKDILRGDGLPNVEVIDLRIPALERAA